MDACLILNGEEKPCLFSNSVSDSISEFSVKKKEKRIYGLVGCTKYISEMECRSCLSSAITNSINDAHTWNE